MRVGVISGRKKRLFIYVNYLYVVRSFPSRSSLERSNVPVSLFSRILGGRFWG